MNSRVAFLLLVVLIPQTRDAGTPPTIGTAVISGVVVDDDQPPQPVRRAVVTLTGTGLHPNRGAITDDDGRFDPSLSPTAARRPA